MTARIVPRPKAQSPLTLPTPAEQAKPPPSSTDSQTLAYAAYEKIYVLLDAASHDSSVQIAERPYEVKALAVHDNRLVDGGDYNRILYTDTDELIRERSRGVDALAVLGGRLVDASGGDICFTDDYNPIKQRSHTVQALAVYNGRLVDSGCDGRIHYTETDEPVKWRPEWVRTFLRGSSDDIEALTVYDGKLVDADFYGRIRYTETGKTIQQRPGRVNALAVLDGRLIDACVGRIRYTETDEPILTADEIVTALYLIPVSLAESLAQRRNLK